jgi:hypothetical protein
VRGEGGVDVADEVRGGVTLEAVVKIAGCGVAGKRFDDCAEAATKWRINKHGSTSLEKT